MPKFLRKLILLLSLVAAANAVATGVAIEQSFAANQPKKAKWQVPSKSANPSKQQKKKKKKAGKTSKPAAKKTLIKKNDSTKKTVLVKDKKKIDPKKKIKIEKVREENTLVVNQDLQNDDLALTEERSSSPLLIVFATFVLCCVGGMLFLNKRKKQLKVAKMNFQEASGDDLAPSSSHERLDSVHPSNSGHETPTTRTLFELTNKEKRTSKKKAMKESSFFGKMSSKAASLIKTSKSRESSTNVARVQSMQFDNEDLSAGSITTIGAVKSKGLVASSKPPMPLNTETTIEPMPTNLGTEPCTFESYTEIQIAVRCWRAQKLPLDAKLKETFNIDTAALIQYEFYWKQKISNNVSLKKKYQELEPLFTVKYEAAS